MGVVATCPCYGLCSLCAGLGVSGTTHPGHPWGRTPAPHPCSVEFLLELGSIAHFPVPLPTALSRGHRDVFQPRHS